MEADERSIRQAFIRHLVANIQCVGCGERYGRKDIYVLGHHESVWVSAVICSRCGTQGLVFATLTTGAEFEVQATSEAEEAALLQALPELSIDDVLDVHAFLKSFSGDVKALFEAAGSSGTDR